MIVYEAHVPAQARTIDLATCLVQETAVMMIVSPSLKDAILDRLNQYIFLGDKVRRTFGVVKTPRNGRTRQ